MPAAQSGLSGPLTWSTLTISVNPASISAGAVANTAVSSSEILAGDVVVVNQIPAALEAGIVPQGCHTVVAGSFQLRLYNPSGGAVDAAAANWVFGIGRR